jgi:hypothetical protein
MPKHSSTQRSSSLPDYRQTWKQLLCVGTRRKSQCPARNPGVVVVQFVECQGQARQVGQPSSRSLGLFARELYGGVVREDATVIRIVH